jgi:hypothetical protein
MSLRSFGSATQLQNECASRHIFAQQKADPFSRVGFLLMR